MKKETREEASEYFAHNNFNMHDTNNYKALKVGFEQGAKWEKERSYSEEEVYHILCEHTAFLFAGGKSTLTEWFEKFKSQMYVDATPNDIDRGPR
jgi:hypothetical protein